VVDVNAFVGFIIPTELSLPHPRRLYALTHINHSLCWCIDYDVDEFVARIAWSDGKKQPCPLSFVRSSVRPLIQSPSFLPSKMPLTSANETEWHWAEANGQ